MYAENSHVQVGTYPDFRQKGRYRIELKAESALDMGYIDAALQQAGYEIVDADQWGRSYRHMQDYSRTAELDELEDAAALTRLILRGGNLDEADVSKTEDQLVSLYDKISHTCQSNCGEYCYEPLFD